MDGKQPENCTVVPIKTYDFQVDFRLEDDDEDEEPLPLIQSPNKHPLTKPRPQSASLGKPPAKPSKKSDENEASTGINLVVIGTNKPIEKEDLSIYNQKAMQPTYESMFRFSAKAQTKSAVTNPNLKKSLDKKKKLGEKSAAVLKGSQIVNKPQNEEENEGRDTLEDDDDLGGEENGLFQEEDVEGGDQALPTQNILIHNALPGKKIVKKETKPDKNKQTKQASVFAKSGQELNVKIDRNVPSTLSRPSTAKKDAGSKTAHIMNAVKLMKSLTTKTNFGGGGGSDAGNTSDRKLGSGLGFSIEDIEGGGDQNVNPALNKQTKRPNSASAVMMKFKGFKKVNDFLKKKTQETQTFNKGPSNELEEEEQDDYGNNKVQTKIFKTNVNLKSNVSNNAQTQTQKYQEEEVVFDDQEEEQSFSKKDEETQKTIEKPSYKSKMALAMSDLHSRVFSGNDAEFSPVQKSKPLSKAEVGGNSKLSQNGAKKGTAAGTNPWAQPKEEQYKVEKDVLAGLKEDKKKYGGKKIEGMDIQQLIKTVAPEERDQHKQSVTDNIAKYLREAEQRRKNILDKEIRPFKQQFVQEKQDDEDEHSFEEVDEKNVSKGKQNPREIKIEKINTNVRESVSTLKSIISDSKNYSKIEKQILYGQNTTGKSKIPPVIEEVKTKKDSPDSKLRLRDDELPKNDYRHPWMQEQQYGMEDEDLERMDTFEEMEEFEKNPMNSRYT